MSQEKKKNIEPVNGRTQSRPINTNFRRLTRKFREYFENDKMVLCKNRAESIVNWLQDKPEVAEPEDRVWFLASSHAVLDQHEKILNFDNEEFSLLLSMFRISLQDSDVFCPKVAEAIIFRVENDSSDIGINTRVICLILANQLDGIRKIMPEAMPSLADAQMIEEFDICRTATMLLREGLANYGWKPLEGQVNKLKKIREEAENNST